MSRPRILVLISGTGSNLQALMDAVAEGRIEADIAAVISNRPEARGLERARRAGIPALVLDHREHPGRDVFDAHLMRLMDEHEPDLVALAGFMRIFTPTLVNRYQGRMLNIHPSLLPKYPGLHTHRRALEAGDEEHGATVHFVTEELDGGPPVVQARVPVMADDDEDRLAARVLAREHLIYPLAVKWFIEGRLGIKEGRACLDGEPLPPGGLCLEAEEVN